MNNELMTFDVEKVAIFGDWHGNLPFAVTALTNAHENLGAELYLHVGDFGFWPIGHEESDHSEYLPGLERLLAAQGKPLLWIDGNHEEHEWLSSFPLNEFGLRPISEHVIHIPRGAALMAGGKKIVGLGGARSIDRGFRVAGVSWFEEELITSEDLERALANGEADILLTHEAPSASWLHGGLGAAVELSAEQQRFFVNEARRGLQAKLLVHGHHHRRYEEWSGVSHIVGLGCDDWPAAAEGVADNVLLVELSSLVGSSW